MVHFSCSKALITHPTHGEPGNRPGREVGQGPARAAEAELSAEGEAVQPAPPCSAQVWQLPDQSREPRVPEPDQTRQ